MRLRRLNGIGLVRLGAFLDSLTSEVPDDYPDALLTDEATSEDLPVEIDIERNRRFARRFDAAAYLHDRLAPLRTADNEHWERNGGLWAWLSLLWFDQLCMADKNGVRNPRERARWIPILDDARRYYRHLLLGPYLIYRIHARTPELALPILCNELGVGTSEVFRTMIETQQFVTSPSVISLIGRLYYDSNKGRLIRGAGTKGAGGVRRLGNVLTQLDRTFDLHSIQLDHLVSLLPREFMKVKQSRA